MITPGAPLRRQSAILWNNMVRRLVLPTQEFAGLVRGSAALKVLTQARLRRRLNLAATRHFGVAAGPAAPGRSQALGVETARNPQDCRKAAPRAAFPVFAASARSIR